MPTPRESKPFRFDVAFSFAGPHRDKVRAIAEIVRAKLGNGKVFFDEWFEDELGGDDAEAELQRIYGTQSLMVVADVSEDYSGRPWCQAEARAVRALRMTLDTAGDPVQRKRLAYIRFNDGEVPGVLRNAITWDGQGKNAQQLADLVVSRLRKLKEELAAASSPSPLFSLSPPPILFFHPATNDERYSRREKELKWLDECAKDSNIRIATVTGQGGLGKTSLVGHWIEKHHGWQHRAFRGVFFYSFYSNRDPKAFFDAFLEFVCEVEKAKLPKDTPLHHLAAAACRKWSYLVVLDGLEVLQHGEDDPHYGWIADGELTEFVARVGAEGASLLVLTSRFPFPRITDEHPAAARALELPLFTNAEGADLLAVCGLTDPRPKLEGYSELLGGHPLALRIFAGACREQPFDDPEQVSRDVRSAQGVETMPDPDEPGLSPEERQKRRQRRQFYKLLRWFQQKLSPPKRRLLQLVALFRDPVRTDALAALALGLDAMKADFAGCDAMRIIGLLDQLSGQFLLQKETSPTDDAIHWTAHPIVRDVFREAALAAGDTVARQFAKIVAGKGEGKRPKTVAEVLPIMEAIEVLLAAGCIKAADELFQSRLSSGKVFEWLPAPSEGISCAKAFLSGERRTSLNDVLGQQSLGNYLHAVGLCANMLGEIREAEQALCESIRISHSIGSWIQVSTDLQNFTESLALGGNLWKAISVASEALFYAGVDESISLRNAVECDTSPDFQRPIDMPPHIAKKDYIARGYRADALSKVGHLLNASRDFSAADALQRENEPLHSPLFSGRGVRWAWHRVLLSESDAVRGLVEENRAICKRNDWNASVARCDIILGELDLVVGNLASAERRIAGALQIFRDARQGKDLPDVLLGMARVRRAVQLAQKGGASVLASRLVSSLAPPESPSAFAGDESALSHCEESLRLARRSGFELKKCDALNFRSLLLRESGQPDKALADAKEAHEIAQRCDYYWGTHEALRQLRDTAQALNRTAEFREWDKAERDLTEKMKPEIAAALEINRQHDAEMERLYGEKKKQRR